MPELSCEEFLEYIRAFNSRDYEKQHSFYDPHVTLTIPDPKVGTLYGSQGIKDHYGPLHADADETVVPIVVVTEGNKLFFIMDAYFKYKRKTDQAVHGHVVEAGDVLKVTVWAYYVLEKKKMTKIVCNLFNDEFLGKVDLKKYVMESQSRADPGLRL